MREEDPSELAEGRVGGRRAVKAGDASLILLIGVRQTLVV